MKLIKCLIIAVCILSTTIIPGCAPSNNNDVGLPPQTEGELRDYNLAKLCKIWGYVKNHHPVFLLGKMDWDLELLQLMPEVLNAGSSKEADEILYNWVAGLEDVGDYPIDEAALEWMSVPEENLSIQADKSWIENEAYLGASLSRELIRLKDAGVLPNEMAPNSFSNYGYSTFSNEKPYFLMDYADGSYRLLGLFRFWNAIEYYFPYKDIMDYDWDALLLEFIPQMLDGTDKHSYELVIASISAKTNDAHVGLTNNGFIVKEFGSYLPPVDLVRAEGYFVVKDIWDGYDDTCHLQRGDIILGVNGVGIEDVIAGLTQYIPVPDNEKLMRLRNIVLRTHEKEIDVTVLRDGLEITVGVKNYNGAGPTPAELKPYELLEGNIGLINPGWLETDGQIHEIVREFAGTEGIIIDLRQYPTYDIGYQLPQYVMDKSRPAVISARPNQAMPGVFIYYPMSSPAYYPSDWENPDYYKNPVVVLMDETTQSNPEFTIMMLRAAPSVVVMGSNSIGADGNVVVLPLPGGNSIRYTGLGVFTPEGGQTQRTGLVPDIYVERTVQGVKESRDELMEAAIRYIKGE